MVRTKRKPTHTKGSKQKSISRDQARKANLPDHYQDYPEDHRWWENRASQIPAENRKPGRPPKFADPEILQQAISEYFEWVETHPLYEHKAALYRGEVIEHTIPKKRVMTLQGLWLFLNYTSADWYNCKQRGAGFLLVCNQAEQTIYNQKFEGAASDFFNASIIARDLGLKDSHEVSGPDDGPIKLSATRQALNELPPDELEVLVGTLDRIAARTKGTE